MTKQNNFILSGSSVYEQYNIKSVIGSGDMGTVFLVSPKDKPEIKYALKYYKGPLQEASAHRFRTEANLLKQIKSKHIPQFYDFYEDNIEMYYVMEYIEGQTLSNLIKSKGRLDTRRAINYMEQINEGIGELHNFHIIHRDIKSQNIMVTKDQQIKIVDLGISLAPGSQRITQTRMVVCSPYYAAPEINEKVTKAVDIYALGIVFYEMLTGKYPFNGKNEVETIKMHKEKQFPNIRNSIDVPWSIFNIIAKAVAKDYKKRYKSVWQFNKDLKEAITPSKKLQGPIDPVTLQFKKTKFEFLATNKFLFAALLLVIFILIITIIIILFVYPGVFYAR